MLKLLTNLEFKQITEMNSITQMFYLLKFLKPPRNSGRIFLIYHKNFAKIIFLELKPLSILNNLNFRLLL